VVAIVYEMAEELGGDEGDGPIVPEPGFFWFPTEGSYKLTVEEPVHNAERGSLAPLDDAALDVAFQASSDARKDEAFDEE
jgi:hypothetical protein